MWNTLSFYQLQQFTIKISKCEMNWKHKSALKGVAWYLYWLLRVDIFSLKENSNSTWSIIFVTVLSEQHILCNIIKDNQTNTRWVSLIFSKFSTSEIHLSSIIWIVWIFAYNVFGPIWIFRKGDYCIKLYWDLTC